MRAMENPSRFPEGYPDAYSGTAFAHAGARDPAGAHERQSLKVYKSQLLAGNTGLPGSPKPQTNVWAPMSLDGNDDRFDNQQLAIDPSLYESKDTVLALPLHEGGPSTTPESPALSPRRASSTKSGPHEIIKSGSTSTLPTPPAPPPPPALLSAKKRKTRKTKRDAGGAKDEEKRTKFLERNRIAASKCREKKKQYVSELEETKSELEAQHTQLQMEYNGLLTEVSGLKHHIMTHAKCNDPNIDRWLSNEARKFVQTSNDLFGAPPADGLSQTAYSSHTRNPSTSSSRQSISINPFDTGSRRDSLAYSQGTSLQTSPTDVMFPPFDKLQGDPSMNYDHMPDHLLNPE
ncbi:hypothetical protein VTK73DRAFT_1617 [Phialemonium thermophilum]|uniref:BZIP domain-containing protein n=1 Tax=Phialemonium thermophilum TaxID=223376 RepID=A0ABR3X9F2_9PEZI